VASWEVEGANWKYLMTAGWDEAMARGTAQFTLILSSASRAAALHIEHCFVPTECMNIHSTLSTWLPMISVSRNNLVANLLSAFILVQGAK